MWKKMLVTVFLVLLGSLTAAAQDKTSCPADKQEVREKVDIDLGIIGYEREQRECRTPEPKEPKERPERKEPKEPKEKPEPKERPDRQRN